MATLSNSIKKGKTPAELRVLIVDDDDFQLEYLSEVLNSLGVTQLSQAMSAQLALKAVAATAQPFDLLIVDLYMPDMDGFQFMEAVAKQGYGGALVIASGQSEDVLRSAALVAELRRFNFLGSVPKPVKKATLAEMLRKLER